MAKSTDFRYNTGATRVPWPAVGENYNKEDLMAVIRFLMKGEGEEYEAAIKAVEAEVEKLDKLSTPPGKLSLGPNVEAAEAACDAYLKTTGSAFVANATAGFEIAYKYANLQPGDEVIVPAITFIATMAYPLSVGAKLVFADLDPRTCNMDPKDVERKITPKTKMIVPVHIGGYPCDMDAIMEIANKHDILVLEDAAHAFGVEVDGDSVLNAGDMSTLSFHATKVYNTIEGGALVMHDEETKKRIDYLKNFGFAGETEVVAPGINSKMDEMRAAYGLLNLRQVDAAIESRHQVAIKYREGLRDVDGISFMEDMPGVKHNYSYFPIFVDAEKYGMTRDELYFKMKEAKVLGRRYFYPLISEFATYCGLPSSSRDNLPNAHKMADSVICLPMHHELSREDIERILDSII